MRLHVIALDVRLALDKIFAILVAGIALASAGLFASRHWWLPAAAASHASALDKLVVWAMIDAGVAFLLAQLALAVLVWRSRPQTAMRTPRASVGVRVAVIVSVLFISLELVSAATLGRRVRQERD